MLSRVVPIFVAGSLLLVLGVKGQGQFPSPSPAPNMFFPAALDDGMRTRTIVSALSDHTGGSIRWGSGGSAMTWRLSEEDPNNPESWYHVKIVESLPFTVTAVASREGGREVYIAGVKHNGDVVIRKWNYGVRQKGWALAAPAAALPIGQAMPEFFPVESLNGSAWVAPPSTTGRPAVRSSLWSSASAEVLSGMVVDPEGRYLLAVSYPSGDVLQFDLSLPVAVPTVLFTAADEPALHKSSTMDIWEHETEGRKVVVSKKVGGWTLSDVSVVLSDSDNDAVFEEHDTLDGSQWDAAGYGDEDVFREYWNTGVELDW